MCPACLASAALMAGSVSTGGIAALVVKMVRGKKRLQDGDSKTTERRIDDGNDDEQDGTGSSGAAS
jgi:hypothetical protein